MFAIHVVTYVSVSLLATFAWALMAGSLPQGPEFHTS
jgi:hypothetical protein